MLNLDYAKPNLNSNTVDTLPNKILIWGRGLIAEALIKRNYFEACEIVGFIDTYTIGNELQNGLPVFTPDEIAANKVLYNIIIVANYFTEEIRNLCIKIGIPLDNVIFTKDVVSIELKNGSVTEYSGITSHVHSRQNTELIRELIPKLYFDIKENIEKQKRLNLSYTCGFDLVDDTMLLHKLKNEYFMLDYARYRAFELAANEIINSNIDGAIAELGVFRGDFASLINAKFSDRKLYLFDTFQGFDINEQNREVESGKCDEGFTSIFKNTSIELVMSKMKKPENCAIMQGLFPDTAIGLENERFAFVSLDVDFEESTYQGLKFFYPRLVEGGYIFIHDYNNKFLEGVKIAIKRFEEDNAIILKKVPIADEGGTIVITK